LVIGAGVAGLSAIAQAKVQPLIVPAIISLPPFVCAFAKSL
jgi:NAD(P) transhydrogenase